MVSWGPSELLNMCFDPFSGCGSAFIGQPASSDSGLPALFRCIGRLQQMQPPFAAAAGASSLVTSLRFNPVPDEDLLPETRKEIATSVRDEDRSRRAWRVLGESFLSSTRRAAPREYAAPTCIIARKTGF